MMHLSLFLHSDIFLSFNKISEVDAFKTSGEEPEIKEADIIISDPHLANLWIQGLPNLRAVLGTWAGVDR